MAGRLELAARGSGPHRDEPQFGCAMQGSHGRLVAMPTEPRERQPVNAKRSWPCDMEGLLQGATVHDSALVPERAPAAAAEFVAGPSDGAWSDTGFQSRICDVLAGVCTACMRFDMESCSDVDDFDDSVSEEAFQFSCRSKGSNVRSMATPARPPGPRERQPVSARLRLHAGRARRGRGAVWTPERYA